MGIFDLEKTLEVVVNLDSSLEAQRDLEEL